ncbi:MAG: glutamate--tRNA ligase [Elusimicrobiota bacterium]|jgi:glutamyl-tRNA synthetase|nr:glutamate--tRNA ligase [Elusimicrobiota bacterium]
MALPRVRFAPSPTGDLHIGGVRTALFNYLFARNQDGVFVLRIEDTDEQRSTDESTKIILYALKWLGLEWDEGPSKEVEKYAPYFQMKRKEAGIYQKYIDELLQKGLAYKCFCSPEEVEEMRKEAQKKKLPPKYDRRCSHLTPQQIKEKEDQGLKPVIRFKIPQGQKVVWDDLIRGHIEFENDVLDDFVIAKANGVPTYNFACVVDDRLQEISHVIRGDDHISNTPKQLLIYDALNWPRPQLAHTAMILGPDGARLSKRHGHTSVLEYQKEGYLPEALLNYLALLGWSTTDSQQIFTLPELIEKFSLSQCGSSPSTFDPVKLLWLNGEKIRSKTNGEIYDLFLVWLKQTNQENLIDGWDRQILKKAIELEHDKIKLLKDIPTLVDFFFKPCIYEDEAVQKVFKKNLESAKLVLAKSAKNLENVEFSAEALENYARDFAKENNLSNGKVFHPLRVAASGRTQGPSLFHLMELLGRKEVIARINTALEKFFS